jgi:tetratricopeptide (TPR) repeat protein
MRYVWLAAVLAAGATAAEKPAPEKPADSPASESSPGELRRLIRQLGDADYFRREKAERQLARLGFEAFDVLGEAAESEDLEIAARARRLLALMRVQWADKGDPPEVKQLLRDYELQNAEGRRAAMSSLAELPGAAGVPALCRLVRYEKSGVLSKHAAILLLASGTVQRGTLFTPPEGMEAVAPKKEMAQRLRANLAGSRRTAAAWLLAWARAAEDPSVMADPWSRLVEAEQALWQASPSQSSPEILAALRRIQVAWLQKLGRTQELLAAIDRLVQLEKSDPDTLGSLLEWLIHEKDWKVLDHLAEQFAPQIAADPLLLYALAEVRAVRGDTAQAEQLAGRALALAPGKEPDDLSRHLGAAIRLQNRGRFAWAKREYRHVIAAGGPTSDRTLQAQRLLAEMLHDQGEEQEAAELLQQLVQAVGINRPPQARVLRATLGEIRARMHFFFACHWAAKGDRARQAESLDKALAEDPSDVDVLIACYRLPAAPPPYREKIRKLIAAAAVELNQKISEEPDDPSSYNQLAWLVGNTEGDLDEALRAASKAVELAPEAGGYYDTLGRVYFAKGDLVNAVKQQTKAVELDPHSGQVARQLALFRKALEESKAKR